tara:strand:+ start:415 stop:747 length:333 start_codon:yes stop_codon:yes gene_type:complete
MIPTLCTINVIEEKDELIVTALAPLYDASKVSRIQIETHHIENYLKENNYSHGKCIQGAKIFNRAPNTLEGTWIFEKKKLDKPAENVILSIEEKKPVLKKRSKAKKKTSK